MLSYIVFPPWTSLLLSRDVYNLLNKVYLEKNIALSNNIWAGPWLGASYMACLPRLLLVYKAAYSEHPEKEQATENLELFIWKPYIL